MTTKDEKLGKPERKAMATVSELLAEFQVSHSTFYESKAFDWLWSRVVYVGEQSPRWHWSDVELFKAMRPTGRRRYTSRNKQRSQA